MAAATTNWMMLDRFVFRRDNAEAFPGDDAAPWARGTTSHGDSFCIAFRIVEPPAISRLYLQWPGGPKEGSSCDLVGAHRNLLLLRLTSSPVEKEESLVHPQDYFLCQGRPPSSPDQPPLQLHQIPICTIPLVFCLEDGRTRTAQRSFDLHTVGILCRGEEFAVAQLGVSRRHPIARVEAELCVLRSMVNSSDHSWEVEKDLPIMYEGDELFDLLHWRTDRVIPFNDSLCWVNYSVGGILFCRVLDERPVISYLRLPCVYRPRGHGADLHPDINCCVCTTQDGLKLISINVGRENEKLVGPMIPGTGFIVTGHTLRTTARGRMDWDRVFAIKSDQLWALDCSLQHKPLIFPLVSMVKPNVLYFLLSEEAKCGIDKVSVVAFDVTTNELSILPYITGKEDLDMVDRKSHLLDPFIPSELPRFLGTIQKKRKKTVKTKSGKQVSTASHKMNVKTAAKPDFPACNTRSMKTSLVM